MPFSNGDFGKLEEIISTFKFRNSAAIEITKAKREKAYTMAVDIVIESVDFNVYGSAKFDPPIEFYGYASLVFQDCFTLEIPLHFPRQRIYAATQWEALRQWREKADFYTKYDLFDQLGSNLKKVVENAGLDYDDYDFRIQDVGWIELPLREIHVLTIANTQFRIEYSQYQPVLYINPITFFPEDGKSNQVDGDKDGGIPESIEPKRNPVDDPFQGNDPPSSEADLANEGFQESGDNEGSGNPLKYVARVINTFRFDVFGCVRKQNTYYYEVTSTETEFTQTQTAPEVQVCNQTHQTTELSVNGRTLDTFVHDSPLGISIIRSPDVPPTETIDLT